MERALREGLDFPPLSGEQDQGGKSRGGGEEGDGCSGGCLLLAQPGGRVSAVNGGQGAHQGASPPGVSP